MARRKTARPPWNTLPEQARQELEYVSGNTTNILTGLREWDLISTVSQQAQASRDLGDIPLLVITAGSRSIEELHDVYESEDLMEKWMLLQRDVLSLSRRAVHRVIRSAGHCNLVTDKGFADRVAEEIVSFSTEIEDSSGVSPCVTL